MQDIFNVTIFFSFWPHFEKQDGCHRHAIVKHEAMCKGFVLPLLEQKDIIDRVLEFAGYVHHYKSLPGNMFGLIWKNITGLQRHFFHVLDFKSVYISLIIGPRGLACEANL